MKKFLSLIMALALVLSLAACGQTPGANGDESSEDVTIIISSEETSANASSSPSDTNNSTQTPAACTHKNIQVTPAVAADCSKEGKTEGKICKDCGAVIVAAQTIPKDEQHYFAAATEDKPATCTVCGLTRGSVAGPATPSATVAGSFPIKQDGAEITYSISDVKFVENNSKCDITYHVSIINGPNEASYSWTVDVKQGDVGSMIAAGFTGSTPTLKPNERYEADFSTGPVDVIGHVGYCLVFR